jgi:flavin-dependent dehydrogenase
MASYDVIVVGARCAGSPTAMLLARKGYRVLLVDRATFPSDIFRLHIIGGSGVCKLAEWGLLDRVLDTNCPPIHRVTMMFGDFPLGGRPPGLGDAPLSLAPRRVILDDLLVRAAVEAGAELREGHPVEDLLWEDGRVVGIKAHTKSGTTVAERARIVVGADGVHSLVARLVQAPVLRDVPPQTFGYWAYWSEVPIDGLEIMYFPERRRFVVAAPTNDGLSLVAVQGAIADFRAFRADIPAGYHDAISLAPDLAERVAGGHQAERFRGTADLPNIVRRPHGPGWALVGDAGYHQDPILAQGILDAFRDADLLADAIDQGLAGHEPLDAALAGYERRRDEDGMPVFERTLGETRLDPFPPDLLRLRTALRGNQADTDRLYGAIFGTVPPEEFWAPDNIGRILASAGGGL